MTVTPMAKTPLHVQEVVAFAYLIGRRKRQDRPRVIIEKEIDDEFWGPTTTVGWHRQSSTSWPQASDGIGLNGPSIVQTMRLVAFDESSTPFFETP